MRWGVEKARVLVVEDKTAVVQALQRALSLPQGGGYRVESCESAEAALERLHAVRFDLLISDLRLPGISGLELIERTHQISPGTRSVLITAFGSPEVEEQARRLVDVYLPKPFSLHDLSRIVRRLLSEPVSQDKENGIDDETLAQRVYRAVDGVDPLRTLGSLMEVEVDDGAVTLRGVVSTYATKIRVLQVVHGVSGVQQVRDELLTESELEIRLAHALAADPRTHATALDIAAQVVNGMVILSGQVPTYTVAQAAEAVAAGLSGVRAVANRLQVMLYGGGGNASFVN